jgi:hypothetical protein
VYSDTPFIFVYHGYPNHYQNLTITGHRLLFERAGFTVTDAGISVGPGYAITQIVNHFIRNYTQGFYGWAFKRLWRTLTPLIRRIDRQKVDEAHLLAANTYVMAEKR